MSYQQRAKNNKFIERTRDKEIDHNTAFQK